MNNNSFGTLFAVKWRQGGNEYEKEEKNEGKKAHAASR